MNSSNTQKYWRVMPAALALAGVIVFTFVTHGPPASSSGFVSAIKGVLLWIAPEYAAENAHYSSLPATGSWLFAFVIGMAIGGFVAGRTCGRPVDDVPQIWRRRFGNSHLLRYLATFVGGFLILFGARLAGGCTLGLFMSGSTQLALSGLYFGGIIFAVAMLTARIVYGSRAGREESS